MIPERGSGVLREVDILISRKLAGTQIRIAIECRDSQYKSDIQWVDYLIGKYRDLPVNKVIGITKKGFSHGAHQKAASAGIDTIHFERALKEDWSERFKYLSLHKTNRVDNVLSVGVLIAQLVREGEEPLDLGPEDRGISLAFDVEGNVLGSLLEEAKEAWKGEISNLEGIIGDEYIRKCRFGGPGTAKVQTEAKLRPSRQVFVKARDRLHQVIEFKVRVESTFSAEPIATERFVMGDILASTAILTNDEGPRLSILMTQDAGEKNQVRVQAEIIP